jgi:molybdate/tungstate transport system substrate-binding protein
LYKLAVAGLYALVAVLTPPPSPEPGTVSVLYAASLVTAMEGPIKNALSDAHVTFEGEPGGSKALANLILAGVRSPDVFISVDPRIVAGLGARVASAKTFAGTSLGIAWAPTSKYAALFNAATDATTLQRALETPGLRIGRTDPQLDPKGAYTLQAVTMWLGSAGERRLLGEDQNPAQIFPEQDLLARVDTGQADVGFFYRTEAIARGYRFIPLPGKASLTDRITYTLAVMRAAPHPNGAKAFADFILTGRGRTILERAGLTYLNPPP